MKIKELKIKSENELQHILKTEREHFRELKFDLVSKKLKKVREVRYAKKAIAKILTLINEKHGKGADVVSENIQVDARNKDILK